MPSPKSGTTVSLETPAEAQEADLADPNQMAEVKAAQQAAQEGKYGAQAQGADAQSSGTPGEGGGGVAGGAGSSDSDTAPEEEERVWVSFELVDDEGNPVANEPYRVKLSDDTYKSGSLDAEGKARIADVPPGNCEIVFPRIDQDMLEG